MKLPFWLKLTYTFIIRFRVIIFLSAFFGVLIFVTINYVLPRYILLEKEYIGVAGRYHTEDLPENILIYVGEGLTKTEPDGTAAPSLAKSWESSEDGKTWTFHLDETKNWHDGTPVTAESLHYAFQDVTVEKPGPHTIIFKLNDAFAPLPTVLSSPTFKKGLLGTGEWRVKKLSLNGSYVEKLEIKSGSRVKIFKFYPSEEAAITAFKLGSVDQLTEIFNPKELKNWDTIKTEEAINKQLYAGIFFNNNNQKFAGPEKKSLRQALSYAIDKKSLGSQRAISPISPSSWAYNPQVKDYAYDPDRAKDLLGEAELSLNLTTTPALLENAEKIASYWQEIGVETTVQVSSSIPAEYEAFLAIYNIPKDPDQYSTWHSTQIGTSNVAKYTNPRINRLLEDGRLETNQEERKKIYLDFQRFLLEDAPAVFLYHPVSYNISRQ